MKKIISFAIIALISTVSIKAQVDQDSILYHQSLADQSLSTSVNPLLRSTTTNYSNGIKIHDTRSANDIPSFNKLAARFDLKIRSTIGVPGKGVFSTNMTLSPWFDGTGGLNHQLSFNEGGIYYRSGDFDQPSWNPWQQVITMDGSGNIYSNSFHFRGKATIGAQTGTDNQLEILGGTYMHSNLRIGRIGESGNTFVLKGEQTLQYNIDFTGYRDVMPDQVGARISGYRVSNYGNNHGVVQATGLSFHTNPSGYNAGTSDLVERMRITPEGTVGIGTSKPDLAYKLVVAGKIAAREVKVDITAGADFVFEPEYDLRPLSEVENFIKENKHLPEIPSEKQMQEEGLSINEFQIKLLQKIEELTLYTIELNKKIEDLEAQKNN